MKESRLITGAKLAQAQGYKYISSVVKRHFTTTYYHYVSIDRVIAAVKWIPAQQHHYGWSGRMGVTFKNLPEHTISRQDVLKLAK